jgi:hypothetical protein
MEDSCGRPVFRSGMMGLLIEIRRECEALLFYLPSVRTYLTTFAKQI